MSEYVTKEAVKQAMRSQPRGILFTEWELDRVPTVDAVEVVHSQWVSVAGKRERICKRCNLDEPYKFADKELDVYNFCPHCGAKMDGGINK